MNRFVKLFMVMGFLTLFCVSQLSAATIVFSDDFEDDTIGVSIPNTPPIGDSWVPYYGETARRAIASNPESEARNTSSQVLLMSRLDGQTGLHAHIHAMMSANAQALIEANGNFTVEYKYYDVSGPGVYGLSMNANSGGVAYYAPSAASMDVSNYYMKGSGEAWCDLHYADATWHDIKVEVDLNANTWVLSLDGVAQSTPANYNGAETPTITDVLFAPGGVGTNAYIDDVVVSTVPEPSTMAMLVIGAFGLMLSYRRKR